MLQQQPQIDPESRIGTKAKKKPVKRKSVILLLILISLLFVAWLNTPAGIKVYSGPTTCGTCHLIKVEVETWENSAHARFDCAICHVKYGPIKTAESVGKWGYREASQLIKEQFQREQKKERASILVAPVTPVADEVCLECHTFNRNITSGDLIVPHTKHAGKRVWCVTCHKGVAHGLVAGKSLYNRNEEVIKMDAQEIVTESAGSPPMGYCMSCHERRKVTKACEACHSESMMPETHLAEKFLKDHGLQARLVLQECDSCHGYEPITVLPQRARTDPVEYARYNPFCKDCHGQKPPSHMKDSFISSHGETDNMDGCFVCHNNTPIQGPPAATRINCNSCHYQTHRKNWQKGHPFEVNGGFNKECYSCHTERTCSSCHKAYNK